MPHERAWVVGAMFLVGALTALGSASIPDRRVARVEVEVFAVGHDTVVDDVLRRPGLAARDVARADVAPLLPGGVTALASVADATGRRLGLAPQAVLESVQVTDSSAEALFEGDRPPLRRLTMLVRGTSLSASRRLALAFAGEYVRYRQAFYEDALARLRRQRTGPVPAATRARAALGAQIEILRLGRPGVMLAEPKSAGPDPLRSGIVAMVVVGSTSLLLRSMRGRRRS